MPKRLAEIHVSSPVTSATEPSSRIVRCKISNKLAFPVGYQLLQDEFGASVNWSEARFYFCPSPVTLASEFTRILRARESYCILRIAHEMGGRPPSQYLAHWKFTVYPVLREDKSVARHALGVAAFDILRKFIARAPRHWNYYNRVDVIFDPTESACTTAQLWPISLRGPS